MTNETYYERNLKKLMLLANERGIRNTLSLNEDDPMESVLVLYHNKHLVQTITCKTRVEQLWWLV